MAGNGNGMDMRTSQTLSYPQTYLSASTAYRLVFCPKSRKRTLNPSRTMHVTGTLTGTAKEHFQDHVCFNESLALRSLSTSDIKSSSRILELLKSVLCVV